MNLTRKRAMDICIRSMASENNGGHSMYIPLKMERKCIARRVRTPKRVCFEEVNRT